MFRWYRESAKCYVYLSDVSNRVDAEPEVFSVSNLKNSRWFTRGWTLQELIAPKSLEFFTREGERIGDKSSMVKQIHEITNIPIEALRGSPLSNFSSAERFAWAADRKTRRSEDKAYCLLGIIDIYMPLIFTP
jgi:hypothetical protein